MNVLLNQFLFAEEKHENMCMLFPISSDKMQLLRVIRRQITTCHSHCLSASRTSAVPDGCRCSSEGQAFSCRLSLSVAACQHADIMQVTACNFRSLTSQLNSRSLYIPISVTLYKSLHFIKGCGWESFYRGCNMTVT